MSSSFVDLLRSGVQGASNAAASNVSGPVDLLAWLLRKGGVPVPSNAFGGSEWMRQQGLTAEPKNKLAGMLGEGVGLAAPFAIAAKAPQIAGAMNKADDALTAGANRMADHFERTGAAYRYDPKQRGAFMGANSKTWDAASNAKAAQMEAAGADPRAIWKETGNWKGPDGKWRQEINDSGLAVKNVKDMPANVKEWFDQIGPAEYPVGTIAQNVTHENLMRAYPELGDVGLTVTKNTGASYTPPTSNFRARIELPAAGYAPVSITDDVVKSKAAHELQHAIQRAEGFAAGGSPEAMIYSGAVGDKSAISNIQKQLEKLARKTVKQGHRTPADDALYLKLQDAKIAQRLDPEEAYKRLAGEAESRAVQARLNMTDAQRRAVFPADSYDRPLSQLIVRGWDGENLFTNALASALKGPR